MERCRWQVWHALGAMIVCVGGFACGGEPPPSSPSPYVFGQPTQSAGAVTGLAIDFSSPGAGRPVPNLQLHVWDGAAGHDGRVEAVRLPDVVTDANGRYTLSGTTSGLLFVETAPGSEYRTICDSYPLLTRTASGPFSLLDLPLVHVSWAGDRPPQPWIVGTSVYGVVTETVGGAATPVQGATVVLDEGVQDPAATTNASGFYMICSVVGTDQFRKISAHKSGYRSVTREIFGGWDFVIPFELTRE